MLTRAILLWGGGATFNVILIKDGLRNRIRWAHKPGRIVALKVPHLRRSTYIVWRGHLLHLVRLEGDSSNHAGSNVRASPPTSTTPEFEADMKFRMSHLDVVG
jgi:hypothetical protein